MSEPRWRKSSRSNTSGECVELARLPHALVGIRDSKQTGSGHLSLERDRLNALLHEIKGGRYAH